MSKGEQQKWKGSRVIVVGMGRSGLAAAEWLLAQSAEVTMFDESKNPAVAELAGTWKSRGATVMTGREELPSVRFDRAILSPGIPPSRPVVRQLRAAKVPITGELELGAQACLCPIVAVTGTNGKSTTTELIAQIALAAGQRAVACGNLGKPICEVAPLSRNLDLVVVEVSSFQLETIETFHPRVAVYLNLTPDHLDRYADMKEYATAKARIFKNQKANDIAVVRKGIVLPKSQARMVTFTADGTGADYTLQDGWLCARGEKVMRQDETRLRGSHNAENLLAALAVADAEKISREAVLSAFRAYQALPHRCEVVAVRAGVTWVNDSKATNLDAMERAVCGMTGPVILIAGGKDKGFDFSGSRAVLEGKVRAVLLLGEMSAKIERAWSGCVPCRRVRDVAEAVKRAAEMARPGESVLLSPGCSSYDMFKNFEDRGDKYRQCVTALPKEEISK
ncbi:MAG: UDP-N-acetylmuramoyl-L-alanine--D-glutamate ligase [Verrucomicrobia bacterium]|nr:UDP-N-acetylmuramoyl-L-alanine--D-glutamate ligase [Verrucomicrobiota bacterium]